MDAPDAQGGWRENVAAYLGLAPLPEGRTRSRWARVTSVSEDSSRQEAAWGLLVAVLLVPLVASPLFGDVGWLRVVAAFSVVILLANVVRVGMIYARLR